MRRRVCGAVSATNVEGMILCRAGEDSQVSRDAGPVQMSSILQTCLKDAEVLKAHPSALVLRIENLYQQDGEFFSVDVLADWGVAELEESLLAAEVGTGSADSVPCICR